MTGRKKPLHIVHVVGSAYAGDWAFYPLKILKEAGHQVLLVCPTDGPLPQRVQREGISVHVLPFPARLRRVIEASRCIRQLTRLLRLYRADVVHNHLVPANIWGRIAAWIACVPVRVTQWPGPFHLEIPISRRIEIATAWMDNGIIAASSATRRIYERYWYTRHKVHLIYYGFPFERFDPTIDGSVVRREFGIRPEDSVVTLVAYMYSPLPEEQLPGIRTFDGLGLKGHEILIQAAAEVKKHSSSVRFLIVGDALMPGEAERYKRRLHQLVSDLGLGDTVIFTGKRADIPWVLSASDVVAVPSLSENVGGAVEPLLMEKPVVASDVGGLPDVVIDGETGFLVPPRDPQALAEGILRLLALPPMRRREMGQQGRKIVHDLFDLSRTVAQTENLYYELMDQVDT
jgi:glycosyltransferase involved in cell wall biosynthesis